MIEIRWTWLQCLSAVTYRKGLNSSKKSAELKVILIQNINSKTAGPEQIVVSYPAKVANIVKTNKITFFG